MVKVTDEQVKEFERWADNLIRVYKEIPEKHTDVIGHRILQAKIDTLEFSKKNLERIVKGG